MGHGCGHRYPDAVADTRKATPGAAARRVQLCALLALALVAPTPTVAIEPTATDPAWPDYAAELLTEEETTVFATLRQQYEQGEFVERFWAARDPDQTTARNELRDEWPQRLGTVEANLGGRRTDRGLAFLLNGPPAFILSELCTDLLRPIEIWFYPDPAAASEPPSGDAFVFVADDDETYQLWNPDEQTLKDFFPGNPGGDYAARRKLLRECPRGREIVAVLEFARSAGTVYTPPEATSWLEAFHNEVLGVDHAELEGSVTFDFPGLAGALTQVDGTVTIRPPQGREGAPHYVLDGDVFRGERRADSFRYEFDAAPDDSGTPIAFSFRRHLAEGSYRLLLTVRSVDDRSIFHTEAALQVPRPEARPETASSRAAVSLKIKPLQLGLLTGRQRVDVVTSGDGVASVTFFLDGRRVMKKSRPPFSVELNLGTRPRTHSLEVIGHDSEGEEVGRDLVPINAGPHRFAVRLVEPRSGHAYPQSLTVHADVNVPPGDKLDRVEIFFNEDRLATLHQPPFIHPNLRLPTTNATGYVRALAILDDGNSVDDLVMINTGNTVDQMQVDFVEIYAGAVDRKGAPLTGLTRDDFTVYEDGVEQTIRRFETVRDLPINAGIVIDTSISMLEELEEAEDAATRFFERVIQSKDRAAVFVFSDKPELRVPLTNDLGRLEAGLDNLEAGGETTLYDSVVFGLYYMVGLRGKRALILLTDGVDSQSSYSFKDTLDFARFSGVAIYSIGIGIPRQDHEARRVLTQLALETGGDSFYIDSASELNRIYSRIEGELRSQYLLGYQSTQSGSDDFRRVEIRSKLPRVDVKAPPGYYP